MSHSKLLACVAVALMLGGCTKDQAPLPPSVTGRWTDTLDTGLIFNLTLVQNGQTVTGNGLVNVTSSMDAATITGTYLSPQVSLTITRTGLATFNVSGAHSGNQIAATLNGGLAVNRPMTLNRQP